MTIIQFTVPGEPVAKGRARAFIRHGHVAHYTPEKTAKYENLVKLAANEVVGNQDPTNRAVRLKCVFYMPIPKSYPKKRAEACLGGVERHCKKPDTDNLLKAIKDGCNGVVWVDDCQVVEVAALKLYSERPRVEIIVETI